MPATQSQRRAKDIVLDLLSILLRPILLMACIKRWINIAALGFLGLGSAMLITLFFDGPLRRFGVLWSSVPFQCLVALFVVFLALLCVPLVHLGSLRWRHFLRLPVYPPAWMAAVFAVGAAYGLKRTGIQMPLPDYDDLTWLWSVGIWIAGAAICLLGLRLLGDSNRPNRTPVRVPASFAGSNSLRNLAADSKGKLIPWLEQEQPVEDPEKDDWFELRYVSQRIAEHFFDRTLATVGLVGPFGVGKSSILRFVEYYLYSDLAFIGRMKKQWRSAPHRSGFLDRHAPVILLCPVSAWGLRDQPGASVILRHAVERLAAEVDCLAIASLPERYAQHGQRA